MLETELKNLTAAIVSLVDAIKQQSAGATTKVVTVDSAPPATTKVVTVDSAPPATTKVVTETQAPPTLDGKYAAAAGQTIDQIRARLMPLVQSKGAGFIQQALAALGVQQLSELSPDKYPALLTKVEELTGGEVA